MPLKLFDRKLSSRRPRPDATFVGVFKGGVAELPLFSNASRAEAPGCGKLEDDGTGDGVQDLRSAVDLAARKIEELPNASEALSFGPSIPNDDCPRRFGRNDSFWRASLKSVVAALLRTRRELSYPGVMPPSSYCDAPK